MNDERLINTLCRQFNSQQNRISVFNNIKFQYSFQYNKHYILKPLIDIDHTSRAPTCVTIIISL